MNHNISSRPGGTDNTEPDETSQRQRRFTDQRGIALQTVIIMVVMLAIAGLIAGVLLSRGNEAADQLAGSDFGISASSYTNKTSCLTAGHGWNHGSDTTGDHCIAKSASDDNGVMCAELNPNWKAGATAGVPCEIK